MVVWIVGLSGSGKTTLAEQVVKDIREDGGKVVLLDGDSVRELYGNDLGHDLEGRKANADRICRLCSFLEVQGIKVVCAILSIFPESRAWCRQQFNSYYEVFIDAPLDQLMARDVKGIYSRYKKGEIKDVAGLDLAFPIPENSELVIRNSGSKDELMKYSKVIAKHVLREK